MRGFPELSFEIEEAVVTALRANSAIVDGILSGNSARIHQRFTFDERSVPGIRIQRIGDEVTELEAPVLLQFDFFGTTLQQARSLRRLTLETVYSDYHFTLGSVALRTEYQGTRREDDPESGVAYLSTDVLFHPYREYT
jgi:hypothetical protein